MLALWLILYIVSLFVCVVQVLFLSKCKAGVDGDWILEVVTFELISSWSTTTFILVFVILLDCLISRWYMVVDVV